MRIKSEHIKFAAKLLVGGALVYYVFFHTQMVDFELLRSVFKNPVNLLVSIVFLAFSAILCASRWHLLVKAQGLNLSFKDLVELTMIGNFFNTFMPGAVGGDLIKAWYVAGQEPKRKAKAVFTVLLDRLIGLSVIVFYAAFTLLFYTKWLQGSRELQTVAVAIWSFSTACLVFGLVFFSPIIHWAPIQKLLGFFRRWEKVSSLIDATLLYRNHRPTVAIALTFSALSILATNFLYSIQGSAIGLDIDLAHYFFIVPLGITVSAIPLLPGGVGVGQFAFYNIFLWTGVANPKTGATLCTLMQIYTILFNCVGAIFYLKFKRKPQTASSVPSSTMPSRRVGTLS